MGLNDRPIGHRVYADGGKCGARTARPETPVARCTPRSPVTDDDCMIRRTLIVRLFAAAVVAVGLAATPAKAGLLPITVSVQPESGNFRWTYSIVLPSDYKLQSGDYFTIC